MRWKVGVVCRHCNAYPVYKLEPKADTKKDSKGLCKCAECRKQFTVTVGTILEDSKIPLNKYSSDFCSSKKGMTAHKLHRSFGITQSSQDQESRKNR